MQNKTLKVSVITVCRNAENVIEKTISSVVGQTYGNIEYIIVDGASRDKTMEIVTRYAEKGNIQYITEPDQGIYDAMNKGIRMSTGDYLEFLNAGDALINHNVIEKVVDEITECRADIVYGNILYHYPDGSERTRVYGKFCSTLFYYLLGDCINHQAIFAARQCFQERGFDTTYRICADREWLLRSKKKKYSFKALNMLICRYSLEEENESVKNHDIYMKEAKRCIWENLREGYFLFWLINKIREGRVSAKVLHMVYKLFFIRNKEI